MPVLSTCITQLKPLVEEPEQQRSMDIGNQTVGSGNFGQALVLWDLLLEVRAPGGLAQQLLTHHLGQVPFLISCVLEHPLLLNRRCECGRQWVPSLLSSPQPDPYLLPIGRALSSTLHHQPSFLPCLSSQFTFLNTHSQAQGRKKGTFSLGTLAVCTTRSNPLLPCL